MQHCGECHSDFDPGDRHPWRCPGAKDIPCAKCPAPELKALNEQIHKHITEKGQISEVHGVFGEYFPNKGFIEEIKLTEKGNQTKFYGCSVLYKGIVKNEVIDSLATVKRVLIETLRLVLRPTFKNALYWFVRIYRADLESKTYKNLNEFSPFPRELIRAANVIADKIPLVYSQTGPGPSESNYYLDEREPDEREMRVLVKRLFYFIGTLVQFDSAYCWRPQDALSNLDKEKLKKSPRKEVLRLFDIAIERESQIKDKIQLFRKFASIILFVPKVRKFAKEYLMELDLEKIKPDTDDDYWAGRRAGYNWKGIDWETRRKQADDLDKRLGNVIIK